MLEVGGHALAQQQVDLDVLLLVQPRPARDLALVEPVGRPLEGGGDELLGKGLAVLEAAGEALLQTAGSLPLERCQA